MSWPGVTLQSASLLLGVLVILAPGSWSQEPKSAALPSLTAAQIANQLEQHERLRAQKLQHYHTIRHYTVEFRGFKTIAGAMDVEANYDAASGKSLRVLSESGSHLLCEKVLRRAVDSEMEASHDKSANALTQANYRFRLLGSENLAGRPAYILFADPIKPSKFLYRGKIWVDATDFAVAKIEAEPSKNPSFWISRTLIQHSNGLDGGFWLPRFNRSESKIRIGGTAVLTIDYGTYQVVPSGF